MPDAEQHWINDVDPDAVHRAAEADAWAFEWEGGWERAAVENWLTLRQRDLLGVTELADAMRKGIVPPKMLTPRVVAACLQVWYAIGGTGKTMMLLYEAVEIINQGLRVFWVDKESGRQAIANRLISLGADPDSVAQHLIYMQFPTLDYDPETVEAWNAALALCPALVAVDAFTEILGDVDVKETDNVGLQRWVNTYVAPAVRVGAGVVMLDHAGDDESEKPRGQTHKKFVARVTLRLVQLEEFGPEQVGRIQFTIMKNNEAAELFATAGLKGTRAVYRLGGSPFIVEEAEAGGTNLADPDALRRLQQAEAERRMVERAIEAIRRHGKGDAGLSRRGVEGFMTGNAAAKRRALDAVASEIDLYPDLRVWQDGQSQKFQCVSDPAADLDHPGATSSPQTRMVAVAPAPPDEGTASSATKKKRSRSRAVNGGRSAKKSTTATTREQAAMVAVDTSTRIDGRGRGSARPMDAEGWG